MNLSLICLGVTMSILGYVTIIRPIQGLEPDIMHVKQLVPVMSVTMVFFPVFLTIAIWPIWGFWSLPYMFLLSMGGFFCLFFLPGG